METLKYFKVSIVLSKIKTLIELQERIIKKAEELFMCYGIRSITMDDIAKSMAISKKTIYQFFSDKNSLVCSVMNQHLELQELELNKIIEEAIDPIDEVVKISDFVKTRLANMNTAVLYEIEKYHPEAFSKFQDHKNCCMFQHLKTNLEKGKELGLYRSDINVEIISKLRLEQVQWGFNPFVFPSDNFTAQQVQLELLNHFIHGICTLKGHKLLNKYKQIEEND